MITSEINEFGRTMNQFWGARVANEDVFTVRPQNVFNVNETVTSSWTKRAEIINSVSRFVLFGPFRFLIVIVIITFYQFVSAFCLLLLSSVEHVKCPIRKNIELFQHLYSDNFRHFAPIMFYSFDFWTENKLKAECDFSKSFLIPV